MGGVCVWGCVCVWGGVCVCEVHDVSGGVLVCASSVR